MKFKNGFVQFHELYPLLLKMALNSPEQQNKRTGKAIRVMRGGGVVSVDLSNGLLPVPGVRKVFPATAAKEVAWCLLGKKDVGWLEERGCSIWSKFVDESVGEVPTAYGYRWRKHFGRDQIAEAIQQLKADPSSRQVMVSAWDPALDGPQSTAKNIPCPTHFTLWTLDDELHSSMFMRSSDLFVGLPYDIMGHSLLMDAIASSLNNVRAGVMTFHVSNLHLYDVHWEEAFALSRAEPLNSEIALPGWDTDAIVEDPDGYIGSMKYRANMCVWPEANPRPEVVL